MRIVSLASGSHGNAYCVLAGDAILLIDCGLNWCDLKVRLARAALDPARIAAVVFTHNHRDHVCGACAFHNKFPQVPLFANALTAEKIACDFKVPFEDFYLFEIAQPFAVGPFTIKAFSIPHDGADPVGYLVTADAFTYFHGTDIGTPLDSIGVQLASADFATLESNHDTVLLHQSARPDYLKRRIRGPRGHLSNDEAAALVQRFASPRLRGLALAHLSEECNTPRLAEASMRAAFAAIHRPDLPLVLLSQTEVVSCL